MSLFATETLLGHTKAEASAVIGESSVLPVWGATEVDVGDQLAFESAIDVSSFPVEESFAVHSPADYSVAASSSSNLGESILNSLASVKQRGEIMQTEMLRTLSKSDLSSGDLLSVQYKLMSLSIELQTTSNMAHHGVEDVKTIMRGQ